jgi:hypothetical protein
LETILFLVLLLGAVFRCAPLQNGFQLL